MKHLCEAIHCHYAWVPTTTGPEYNVGTPFTIQRSQPSIYRMGGSQVSRRAIGNRGTFTNSHNFFTPPFSPSPHTTPSPPSTDPVGKCFRYPPRPRLPDITPWCLTLLAALTCCRLSRLPALSYGSRPPFPHGFPAGTDRSAPNQNGVFRYPWPRIISAGY